MESNNPRHAYLIEQIKSDPVVLYTTVYCPYCIRAKETLTKMGVNFKLYEVDRLPNGNQILNDLEHLTNQDTVPNIFIGGKHVGGNSELQQGLRNGSVQELLRNAGINYRL